MQVEQMKYYVIQQESEEFGVMYYMGDLFVNDISKAKTYAVEQLATHDIDRYRLQDCKPIKIEVTYHIHS